MEICMSHVVKHTPSVNVSNVLKEIDSLIASSGVDTCDVLAEMIRRVVISKTPLGKILRYVIDTASDEFLSEEYYHTHHELLIFLARAGSGVEELLYRAYAATHPDVFTCKKCKSPLIGGCPVNTCSNPDCGRRYYVKVDGISNVMCENCVASKLGDCSEDKREHMYKIYALYGGKYGI
jgi:hypothetical protein